MTVWILQGKSGDENLYNCYYVLYYINYISLYNYYKKLLASHKVPYENEKLNYA